MVSNISLFVGNLTSDPEIKFLDNGTALAKFTVAVTERGFNKEADKWEDRNTLYVLCNAWRETAEHIGESLNKGDRVMVTGLLEEKRWEKDGQTQSRWELRVDEIAASLKFADVDITKKHDKPKRPLRSVKNK